MCDSVEKSLKQEKNILYDDDYFCSLDLDDITNIRSRYKVIDVDWFGKTQVNLAIFNDKYFYSNPHKEKVINDMVEHFLTHNDKNFYKKTNYLCNKKEQLCICNTNANNLRKIYNGVNYKDDTYCAWVKKPNEPF